MLGGTENINRSAHSGHGSAHHGRSGIIKKTEYFDLFISYKRDENGNDHGQEMAFRLYRELTAIGLKVWIDREEIGLPGDFEVRIGEAILHSKKFVAILSPGWLDSKYCFIEYKKALEYGKRIIPVNYQFFRKRLLERYKSDTDPMTEDQWRRLDKPQELNFSQEEYFESSFEDLVALSSLKDKETSDHTKLMCESHYWANYGKPNGMLLRGVQLKKTRRLKAICNGDPECPSFVKDQDEFLEASEKYASTSTSVKRRAFLAFSPKTATQAAELDLELRLHDVSTWFDDFDSKNAGEEAFSDAILQSDLLIHVVHPKEEGKNLKVAFAEASGKRILKVTDSEEYYNSLQKEEQSNVYLWSEGMSSEKLIATVKGDSEYQLAYDKLADEANRWSRSDRSNSRLLPLKEAKIQREWYQIAETENLDPPPKTFMIDFVERSVIHGEAMLKRKRMAFWTTGIGIVLLVGLGIATAFLQREASKAIDDAENKKREAERLQEQSLKLTEILNIQGELSAAESRVKNLEFKIKEKAYDDTLQTKLQKIEEQKAFMAEEQKKFIALDSTVREREKEMLEVESNLEAMNQKVLDIMDTVKKYNSQSIGRSEARSAFHYIRFGVEDLAHQKADNAVENLEAGQADIQIQPLYEVYKELVDSTHILNSSNRHKSRNLDTLLGYFEKDTSALFPSYGSTISSAVMTKITTDYPDAGDVSTYCFNSDKSILAVGRKDGTVTLYNTQNKESIQSFKYHSHRITSMVFSPSNEILAVTAIDETFTVTHLNEDYTRNNNKDIIEQDAGSRVKKLYFLGNSILITMDSWGAKAWGIDVKELKKIAIAHEH